jgi:hypothetical protein
MMMTTAVELKRRVELARGGRRRARLPLDLRRALVAHVRARRERGVAWSAIEAEVGVSAKRLYAWMSARSAAKASTAITVRPRLSAVRVVPDHVRGRDERGLIIVRGARSVSVEGLSVRDVAELLAELSL